ncbi:hypothetical protein B7P43_G06560 [Cryptotermes secundus]|uniref:Uncharacterized protein n=1 Tax=Cryptotermes secundus TaxID=105785 RepID=A0A2J7QTR4_9NEOP|nr:hypothetical protein B7P43_G06560 [Cryptotermes secundus]
MCNKQVSGLQKILHSPVTGVPRIMLRRAEEIFPSVRESMNYTTLEKVMHSPCGETCPTMHDANHTMNIKAEEVSDAEGEGTSVTTTFVKIKAETAEEVPDTEIEESPMLIPFQKIKAELAEVPDAEVEEPPMPIPFQKIKAELAEVPDAEVEEPPMPIPFQKIKAEPAEELSDAEGEKVPMSTAFVKIKPEPEGNGVLQGSALRETLFAVIMNRMVSVAAPCFVNIIVCS